MADRMMPPMGGPPPMGGGGMGGPPPGPKNPMDANRSVLNPTDATMMSQKGQLSKDMTVKDLILNVLKVPLEAPASELVAALKRQVQNASPTGKIQAMAGGPGAPPPGGQMPGRPPMAPRDPQSQGLSDLMGRMGR